MVLTLHSVAAAVTFALAHRPLRGHLHSTTVSTSIFSDTDGKLSVVGLCFEVFPPKARAAAIEVCPSLAKNTNFLWRCKHGKLIILDIANAVNSGNSTIPGAAATYADDLVTAVSEPPMVPAVMTVLVAVIGIMGTWRGVRPLLLVQLVGSVMLTIAHGITMMVSFYASAGVMAACDCLEHVINAGLPKSIVCNPYLTDLKAQAAFSILCVLVNIGCLISLSVLANRVGLMGPVDAKPSSSGKSGSGGRAARAVAMGAGAGRGSSSVSGSGDRV